MGGMPIAAAPPTLDWVQHSLVGLEMPRAFEVLDHVERQIERGETSALEAIDTLLAEELTLREGGRIKAVRRMATLTTVKTLQSYDFSFQPSLDRNRNRILARAQLDFITRHEVLHLLGSPSASKLSVPAAASTFRRWSTSSPPWPGRHARARCASAFGSCAGPRC